MTTEKADWEQKLAGGFAHMTAPFAVHKNDEDRAREAVALAKEAGRTPDEFLAAARAYLETAMGWPTNIEKQLSRVEEFINKEW